MNISGRIQSFSESTSVELNVVDWNLPHNLQDWDQLWDYGALAALTDCVYYNMANFGYVYIVDMDEFVVPKDEIKPGTTESFVLKIEAAKRPPINKTSDAFLFKNTFFCSEFNPDADYEEKFDIFSASVREDFLWSYKLRAKMLVKSREVVAVGHHR